MTRYCRSGPLSFLTDDGPAIVSSLRKTGALPWCCRVKWLSSSMSRVYAVMLPDNYTWGGERKIGIDSRHEAISYVVKVVEDTDTYQREFDALKLMAANEPANFYALGGVPADSDAVLFGKASWFSVKVFLEDYCEDSHWWELHGVTSQEGGVIFMHAGVGLEESTKWNDVVDGICKSLRSAHKANLLHCDIRRSNVLKFGGEWRVVDFGLCCQLGAESPYSMQNYGAQAAGVGPRVRGLLDEKESITWRIANDYEMLLHMLKKMSN